MEKFEKIFEETELQLKDTQLDILLYQMKMAVPKGRNFNTLNAIVIVDFLKQKIFKNLFNIFCC